MAAKSSKPLRGMHVSILRDARLSDCTGGGVTSAQHGATSALLVGDGVPEIFEAQPGDVVLMVVRRRLNGGPLGSGAPYTYVHAEPIEHPEGMVGPMAGGNFVYSCDSRFRSAVCAYPIAVHDRFETPAAMASWD